MFWCRQFSINFIKLFWNSLKLFTYQPTGGATDNHPRKTSDNTSRHHERIRRTGTNTAKLFFTLVTDNLQNTGTIILSCISSTRYSPKCRTQYILEYFLFFCSIPKGTDSALSIVNGLK